MSILLKTKSPNKKRSADLKSALNFEFNYVPRYIYGFDLDVGCEVFLSKATDLPFRSKISQKGNYRDMP